MLNIFGQSSDQRTTNNDNRQLTDNRANVGAGGVSATGNSTVTITDAGISAEALKRNAEVTANALKAGGDQAQMAYGFARANQDQSNALTQRIVGEMSDAFRSTQSAVVNQSSQQRALLQDVMGAMEGQAHLNRGLLEQVAQPDAVSNRNSLIAISAIAGVGFLSIMWMMRGT